MEVKSLHYLKIYPIKYKRENQDFSGDWGERHDGELGAEGQAQQTSGEDFSGDWGERHDGELGAEGQAQQTSGEPDAAQEQPVQYTDLPLDAEGYPVE